MIHKPVFLKEIIKIFNPGRGETYVDATINGGGHTEAILKKTGYEGKLLGIDWDCDLIERLKIKYRESILKKNLILVCGNYVLIGNIVRKHNLGKIGGVLFDFGFSSYHIEKSGKGFSFLRNEPLDMRYNPHENNLTAEKIVNVWPEKAIENIFREFGGERFSRRIARGIVCARSRKKIATTAELVEVILKSVPAPRLRRIHPATRVFQALRIAVNGELENLKKGLAEAADILAPGGKITAISYHSLEDRIVKDFFRKEKIAGNFKIITPKPLSPSAEEMRENPRARSAKLRAAEKI